MKKYFVTILFLSFFLKSYEQTEYNVIVKKIKDENRDLIIPDSAHFFINGYMHLEGKIGYDSASIELNVFPQTMPFNGYLFSNPVHGLFGLTGNYSNGILHLYYDDYKCVGSLNNFYEMYLGIKSDSSFTGYIVTDTNKTITKCLFKETYFPNKLIFKNLNFIYSEVVNKFSTQLYGNFLFTDTQTTTGKVLNQYLLKWNDELGLNYKEEVEKIDFRDLQYLKTRKTYKAYCVSKFKKICKRIINKQFILDAKESGHDDVYLNGFNVEVLVNDGKYVVLQMIVNLEDGSGYPYYETKILQYDVEKNKIINISNTYLFKGVGQDELSEHIDEIIVELKKRKLYDSSNSSFADDEFLYNHKIAFVTKNGYVLTKNGGNHGIHNFYKFYSKDLLKPYLIIKQ